MRWLICQEGNHSIVLLAHFGFEIGAEPSTLKNTERSGCRQECLAVSTPV